jgi:Lon protease-like protein
MFPHHEHLTLYIVLLVLAFTNDVCVSLTSNLPRYSSYSQVASVMSSTTTTQLIASRYLFASSRGRDDLEDSPERATPLSLSAADLARLQSAQARQSVIPIMILDSMLPKQKLTFQSNDPKFRRLIEYCLRTNSDLGMLGVNPQTRRPLCRGVTVKLLKDYDMTNDSILVTMIGNERIEVQGEPWLDESKSFYLANIESVDGSDEPMTRAQEDSAQEWYNKVPHMVQEWQQWVIQSGSTDRRGLHSRMTSLGPMPTDRTERALWAAAVINPLPALGVCLEIRPAVLACNNDAERLTLVGQAIQSSMDHLSGKKRLF